MILKKNIAIYMVADILGSGVWLITSPITTRLLTPEQYGAAPLLMALWSVVALCQYGGMDWAFPFFCANRPEERVSVTVTATFIATSSALITFLLFSAVALLLPAVRDYAGVSIWEMLAFLAGLLPMVIVSWYLYILRFNHQVLAFARVSVLSRTLGALVALPAMALATQEHRLAVGWWIIAMVSLGGGWWALYELRSASEHIYDWSVFSQSLARSMFRYGMVLVPGGALYVLVTVTDRVLIGVFLGPAEVGVYWLAVSLASSAILAKVWFARAWDPLLVEWIGTRNPAIYIPNLQRTIVYITILLAPIPVVATIWGKPIVDLLYPASFSQMAQLLPLLIMVGVVSTLSLVAVATVMIANTPRYHFPNYLVAFLINAVTGIFLIPRVGLWGAVVGMLVAEVWILIAWIALGRFILANLRLSWGPVLTVITLAATISSLYQPSVFFPNSVMVERVIVTGVLAAIWTIGWRIIHRAPETIPAA